MYFSPVELLYPTCEQHSHVDSLYCDFFFLKDLQSQLTSVSGKTPNPFFFSLQAGLVLLTSPSLSMATNLPSRERQPVGSVVAGQVHQVRMGPWVCEDCPITEAGICMDQTGQERKRF